jgi:hypothetical protein
MRPSNLCRRALLIGINYINSPEISLNGCIDDVINARNILIDAYDYDETNITVLRDDMDNSTNPTNATIISELKKIVSESAALDEIWIQYSGHGSQINNAGHLGDVIVPVDYEKVGFITDDMLVDIFKSVSTNCNAVLIFDCCHSGNICKFPWTASLQFDDTVKIERTKEVVYESSDKNCQCIYSLSGCKDSQTSSDTYSRELNQGVGAFSNAINECLRASHHQIDILTLYKNVCKSLVNDGYTQTPVLTCGIQTPNYVFSRRCAPIQVTKIKPVDVKLAIQRNAQSKNLI